MTSTSKHTNDTQETDTNSLQVILNTITTQAWTLTDSHTYGIVNKEHAKFFGLTTEDLSLKSMFEVLPEEATSILQKGVQEVFTTKQPFTSEEKLVNSKGESRVLLITKTPKLIENNLVEYVICSAEDITDKKNKEEEFSRYKSNNRITIDNLLVGLIVHASDSSILQSNPAASEILGLSPEQIRGKQAIDPVWQFVQEDLSVMKLEDYPVNRVVSSEKPLIDYVAGIVRPDRDYITWVIINAIPVFTETSSLDKVIINFSEITRHKQAEQELKSSVEKFRAMYDNAPLSYQSLDINGNLLDVNPAWMRTLGYTQDEVIGKNFSLFLHQDSKKQFTASFSKFIKQGYINDVQLTIMHKNNFSMFISLEGTVAYNQDRTFKQTLCVFQDITSKKKAELALIESERKLRNIFENSTNLFYSYTTDHIITYMSPQVEQMLGYTVKEAMINWTELTSDNPINEIGFENTVKAIQTGERQPPYELELVRKDGKKIWVEVREFPSVENGKTIAMLGSLTEITERKVTLGKLKESEERFRLLYENSPDMFVSVSAKDGIILRCNNTLLRKTGYSKDDVVGAPIFSIYHPDSKESAQTAFLQFVETGVVTDKELVLAKKDGTRLPVSLNVNAIRDESGKVLHSISSWRDISDRAKAKAALKESEEKFRTIFENKGTAVGLFDKEGIIIDCNRLFVQMSGFSKHDLVGKLKWSDFIIKEDMERLLKINSARNKKNGSAPSQYECGIIDKYGKRYDVLINITLSGDTRIVSLVDITERKKAQLAIQQMQKLEGLGTIAGGIAHDFNNLLTGVFANLEMAKMNLPTDTNSYHYLEEAHHAIQSARSLTGQLLTFAKGGSPVLKKVDTVSLLKETVEFNLHGSKVKPEFNLPENLWSIKADKGQLEQVIANLAINAKQAMPSGGILRIEAQNIYDEINETSTQVLISITDEGIGIPEKIIKNIFDPYFSTKDTGHGLGLAVVHSIIQQHNGSISVESVPNIGTTFTIILPALKIEEQTTTSTVLQPAKSTNTLSKLNILIMDDEAIIRDIGKQLLELLGHSVTTSVNGDDALGKYTAASKNNKPFDLVIMDITIRGGKGGEKAIKEFLDFDPKAKVIVSSGYASGPLMANYKSYGFSGKLAKPFLAKELKDEITRVMSI